MIESSHYPAILVLILAILVGLGLLFHFAFGPLSLSKNLRLLRALLGAKRGGFDAIAPGRVSLLGRVVPIDPVVSEETGRSGVFLRYVADVWRRSSAIGLAFGQWHRSAEEAEAAPFEITDGKHSVLVDPEGAKFEVPLGEPHQLTREGELLRYTEALLEEGTEVLVRGEAVSEGGFDPSSGYRGHTMRTVVGGGETPLFISPSKKLALRLFFRILPQLFLVLAILVAGLAFALLSWTGV